MCLAGKLSRLVVVAIESLFDGIFGIFGSVFYLTDGALGLALGLVQPAFLLHFLVVGQLAEAFLGITLDLIDLTFDLVFCTTQLKYPFGMRSITYVEAYGVSGSQNRFRVYAPRRAIGDNEYRNP